MIFFWIIVIIVVVWWLASRPKKTSSPVLNSLNEESVFRIQQEFEKRLRGEYYHLLPDSLSGQEVYIYRHLMCRWFDKLSAENRYKDKIQIFRQDFLKYIALLERSNTSHFLSMEAWKKNPKKSDDYGDQARLQWKQAIAIENAFAEAIGSEAVDELGRVRSMDLGRFDKSGNCIPT